MGLRRWFLGAAMRLGFDFNARTQRAAEAQGGSWLGLRRWFLGAAMRLGFDFNAKTQRAAEAQGGSWPDFVGGA
ncbi:MAG: hypothetical protein CO108_02255 [Deltaproteobacteria bacterium CG_4_9_14_3_um_filter_63_12]|nr:MAG: hypothetical protein CO108_02255 [Deltaproteobacteria bacterium CG_4_9_14_3_um_filter_63_12]